jgi:flavin reductase (DIM6/NTAB) family NADH-FMN oxidoreductase RutF
LIVKEHLDPYTALYPVPVVLVTCSNGTTDNIITLAWVGTVCSEPPMLSISVRPSRFSHGMIVKTGEFAVNIPTKDMLPAVKLCGRKTGAKVDKWEETGLTKVESTRLRTPLIGECPVNIECKVTQQLSLGVHDMFLAEILAVQREKDWGEKKMDAISFIGSGYYSIGTNL